jgi:hypothetical protein
MYGISRSFSSRESSVEVRAVVIVIAGVTVWESGGVGALRVGAVGVALKPPGILVLLPNEASVDPLRV